MECIARHLNTLLVAGWLAAAGFALMPPVVFAQDAPGESQGQQDLDALFAELADPAAADWQRAEQDIWREWSKSGSPAMDLLLQRGRDALQAGDVAAAVEHLTALTDHAPDFAEGWNARATAYFQGGEYGPSIADIRRTLALNPRHFGALSGLGMILEELDAPQDALKIYNDALAIHPRLPGVVAAVARLDAQLAGQDI